MAKKRGQIKLDFQDGFEVYEMKNKMILTLPKIDFETLKKQEPQLKLF